MTKPAECGQIRDPTSVDLTMENGLYRAYKVEKKLFIAVGLLTGHNILKGHLHKMGFYNGNFSYKMFDYGNETPYHILCVKSPK
mgnify:CR=1 FL=1